MTEKCRVPMWTMGCPNGFCGAEAFGTQLPPAVLFQKRNLTADRVPYCFGPCCPSHGGPKVDEPRVYRDGLTERGYSMWCAVNPDFENLQESPAGFDADPLVALAKLAKEPTHD